MKPTIILTTVLFFIVALTFAQVKTNPPKKSEKEISKNKTSQAINPSVKIGTQEWMIRNLNVEKFADGSIIPEAKSKEEWILAGKNGKTHSHRLS